ncbi:MAG: DUF4278 domain-containing protein [Cyanobacteria bacterium J06635_1]
MQLKYRGIAYTPKPQTIEYPFSEPGCYRRSPIQLGEPHPKLGLRKSRQLVYRGVPYLAH